MKISRVFLDVNVKRNKIFVDERRQTGVFVRLSLESSAGASGGCRAEIDQQRPVLVLCPSQSLVGVLGPVD